MPGPGWIGALLTASLLAWPAAAQHSPPPADKIDVPDGGVSLPMGCAGGRPIVEVRINGKGPYRFILDTGASITVVGDDLADELKLPPANAATIAAPVGGMDRLVRIDDLRAGDAALKGALAAVGPLARLFRAGDAPRGVLSASSFPGYLLILDYPGKRIVIRSGELPPADSRSTFQYTPEQVLPNVPIQTGGRELRVHVDTGAPGALSLPTQYMKELPLASEPAEAGHARTPGGEFTVWSASLKAGIELGRYKLEVPTVRFSDVNPVPGPPTGNIGYEVLKRFVVTLDSKNRRIHFDE